MNIPTGDDYMVKSNIGDWRLSCARLQFVVSFVQVKRKAWNSVLDPHDQVNSRASQQMHGQVKNFPDAAVDGLFYFHNGLCDSEVTVPSLISISLNRRPHAYTSSMEKTGL